MMNFADVKVFGASLAGLGVSSWGLITGALEGVILVATAIYVVIRAWDAVKKKLMKKNDAP